MILSQFDDIDEKVEYLLELCLSLKTANTRLRSRIEILEQEIKVKSEAEKRYSERKEKIRIKIDHLLEKLNEISEISP